MKLKITYNYTDHRDIKRTSSYDREATYYIKSDGFHYIYIKDVEDPVVFPTDIVTVEVFDEVEKEDSHMDYKLTFKDFYRLAKKANENWRGKFTEEEVAENAEIYFSEYKESVNKGFANDTIETLVKNILEDFNLTTSIIYLLNINMMEVIIKEYIKEDNDFLIGIALGEASARTLMVNDIYDNLEGKCDPNALDEWETLENWKTFEDFHKATDM